MARLRAGEYDEVVVVPHRTPSAGHTVDFAGAWAPCAGRNVAHAAYPPVAVSGTLLRGRFRASAIVGHDDRPSAQLQRLKSWRIPVPPYAVVAQPTAADLLDLLVGWARADGDVDALQVMAWKRRSCRWHFLFHPPAPVRFVDFRVALVQWRLADDGEYTCVLQGRAYNRGRRALRALPCSGADVVAHAVEPGCVVTAVCVGEQPTGLVGARRGATGRPQLPVECVVEGGAVRAPPDLCAIMEIRAFLQRAVGAVPGLQQCWGPFRAGARTVGDWLALTPGDVAPDSEWARFFDARRRACLDRPALMHASGCFGALGGMKLALAALATAHDAPCPYDLCGVAGLTNEDVRAIVAAWPRYAAFLRRHRLQAVQLEFEVRAVEERARPTSPPRAWSFPPSHARWLGRLCHKPPPSPDLAPRGDSPRPRVRG